jgi:HSP20 family protein
MIRDLVTLQDRMNRLFSQAFPGRTEGNAEENDLYAGDFTPAVDIYEDENAITLKADIPGIDPDTLDIRVEGNRLVLRGERNMEKEVKRENFYRMERSYGSFTRIFALPQNVQADKIDANYKNGVLHVSIPKKEEAKPKQVKVKFEGTETPLKTSEHNQSRGSTQTR